ncbi:MurR/RpiR family transcriptional regulator [Deinococcus yavapaiensis]|uniref:RpiR family transcriptional regulator n=1 Tax=Deinococcus yavapaiensis KR-236 TaxID=694435 RepID=A0A318S8P6_9DEIO|nr:MurR/RpiR family transcriptional regulator [Deinococcus yavapaiensis]PYE52776.1 RpiR family transcriptional regulator [Deinococcus yavapaiensis KR-236]
MTTEPTLPSLPNGAMGRLKAQRDFLSPSLRRVADHILVDADKVIYQTITELAANAGVGEATITRLCRKIGFAGFHAFKIALTTDVAHATPRDAPSGDGILDLATSAVRHATLALEETRRILNFEVLERVVDAIVRAPRVDVTGQGNSAFAAQFFAHKLMRLGIAAVAHPDPHIAVVSAATLPPSGVLIGMTRSGSTIDTIQTLKVAARSGVYTVAITNRASSPVTQHAADILYTVSPEGPLAGGALSSIGSQLLVVEVLYLSVAARTTGAHDAIRKTAESIAEKKY